VPEIIEHGKTGILVAAGDPQALADAVHRVLHDPQKAQALCEAAHASAVERFSVANMLAQIDAEVCACVDGPIG
jgi:glycosyltransferase involved in cell wall biosynthesis